MFDSQQEVRWHATRYKFSKTWGNHAKRQALSDLQMSNYTKLLVACFSHLFNVRLRQSGKAIG
jgi:hypothetical protein